MFTLIATNYCGTVNFEESYLEWRLAEEMFYVAARCVDCKEAVVINASTGEVILDYEEHLITDYR